MGPNQAATTSDEVLWKKEHIHHSLPENKDSFTPLALSESPSPDTVRQLYEHHTTALLRGTMVPQSINAYRHAHLTHLIYFKTEDNLLLFVCSQIKINTIC